MSAPPDLLWTAVLACGAVLLDHALGEPRRAHPLVGFGHCANGLEARLNLAGRAPSVPACAAGSAEIAGSNEGAGSGQRAGASAQAQRSTPRPIQLRALGVLAWLLAVVPPVALAALLAHMLPFAWACGLHLLLLWFALGARSLTQHLEPIARALQAGDLARARAATARIVSRDTGRADATALATAAVESALENGNDAIFGALFWFALAGGPGALAFRLANTLDAMWGYRTARYLHFGWAAARLDDLANWAPARLTALSYAVCGNWRGALACWRSQAPQWDSPNAGPVMASGAGSLQVQLGGVARYHGHDEIRPQLGAGPAPVAADIGRARQLVRHSMWLWLALLLLAGASRHV
jgi:adenosylcobinamide-phosphate synthase